MNVRFKLFDNIISHGSLRYHQYRRSSRLNEVRDVKKQPLLDDRDLAPAYLANDVHVLLSPTFECLTQLDIPKMRLNAAAWLNFRSNMISFSRRSCPVTDITALNVAPQILGLHGNGMHQRDGQIQRLKYLDEQGYEPRSRRRVS